MNLNAKYDVFISYSRRDYVDENGREIEGNAISALMSFLDANNVSFWVDKKGIYSGAEFGEIIADAITESKMMIFVSSTNSNISEWTAGEILEAKDQGKLVVPFKIDESNYNAKFRIVLRPLDYIEYFANPTSALDSLLKTINKCKTEYDNLVIDEQHRKEAELAEKRKQKTLEEIRKRSEDYMRSMSNLEDVSKELVEMQVEVGNTVKACPICDETLPVGSRYCIRCGWTFVPAFDIAPKGDEKQLLIMRGNWNALSKEKEEIERLKADYESRLRVAEESYNKLKEELEEAKRKPVYEKKSDSGFTMNVEKCDVGHVKGKTFSDKTDCIEGNASIAAEKLKATVCTGMSIGKGVLKKVPNSFEGHFVIGDDVTSIGDKAFALCHSLTRVTIPQSVTSIGKNAFFDCINLKDVTIPNGVTSIESYAFYRCAALTNVTIPNSVTSIGDQVFAKCNNLKAIYVPAGSKRRFVDMLDMGLSDSVIENSNII